jgi:hypothetical protein
MKWNRAVTCRFRGTRIKTKGIPMRPKIECICQVCQKRFYEFDYNIRRRGRKYCTHSCQQIARNKARIRPAEERFWEKVDRTTTPDGCWLWIGSTIGPTHYGQFRHGSDVMAHRVAWILAHGPIPEGLCVCHTCDVPLCVNPAHLWLGTNQDNVNDKVAKGRQPRGKDLTPYEHRPRGECAPKAKLTADQVREIRKRHAPGSDTYKILMAEFGISQHAYWCIISRKSWKHVL